MLIKGYAISPMKLYRAAFLLSGMLALFFTGCAHQLPHPVTGGTSSDQKQWSELVQFPRQALTFKPTRVDFTVGKVILSLYCSEPDAVRVNGVSPDPEWGEVHLVGTSIVVDTRVSVARSNAWMYIQLPEVATNRFELAPLTIEVSSERHGFLCMSVKAWFNEVPNEYDGMFYQNLDDRYALISYCTGGSNYPSEVRARFGMNQVATVEEFKETLARPCAIKLNERPIRDEWRSR